MVIEIKLSLYESSEYVTIMQTPIALVQLEQTKYANSCADN